MPKILCPILNMFSPEQTSRLKLFAVDERLVPLEDPDSNAGVYLKDLPVAFREKFASFKNPTDGKRNLIEGGMAPRGANNSLMYYF